jgi:hypothetical protein
MDDLEQLLHWWRKNRAINTPTEFPTNFNTTWSGVVLYRKPPYQVQLFIVHPNSEIVPHLHPNVDSFEVFVGGDISFMHNGQWFDQNKLGFPIRVKPNDWHGGKFGKRGGAFLSVQKWLNDVPPTSVDEDWHDKDNNTRGTSHNYG